MKVIFGLTCQSILYPQAKCHNTTTLTYLKGLSEKQKPGYLKQKALQNLKNFPALIQRCIEQDLYALRINDNLIPMADMNYYDFEKEFKTTLKEIGKLANKHNMYLSYHPSQFFLLTSKNKKVIDNSVKNFNIFARILKLMQLKNKPILLTHVGALSCYSNWEQACDAFCENFKLMSKEAQDYFAIQNDQNSHSIDSCMYIHAKLGIPVVFDHAHYHWNPVEGISMRQAVRMSMTTWKNQMPKVHLCSQAAGKNVHTHADNIDSIDYINLKQDVASTGVKQCIFMVQVKQKDAAIKKLKQQLGNGI